ncbi:hypothetical protein K3X44_11110 [Aliiroseovarius crassostreae]|uniref:hypothetical protein n=1 Tax=Aliiroseovarius crassostreae TaxID=154981 RepID=UPI00220A6451|nr:hypothetical protein [Aliiroseovarius crassostreae]UWQ01044.1 hypothetical protein K3X44_11110 [Aliiroseovarius crassostreae]
MNFPAMLLMIGYLTTPTTSTGVSLSEFWAWVRYLSAITPDSDLRLTSSFSELDAHQKTILSDDFGMGAPLLWLSERLDLDRIVDGRYFVEYLAPRLGATQQRTAKRGPNKTPDFVARDTAGVWHVIECKGTQSGSQYSARQLGDAGPPPSGGVAQKRSILFPAGHTGQRLVSGLQIGVPNGTPSRLTIIDPESDDPFAVNEADMELADDAATRCVVSKVLRQAGFEIAAEAMATPHDDVYFMKQSAYKKFSDYTAETEERDARAREELGSRERTVQFAENYVGHERQFVLPRPVLVGDMPVYRVILRQGLRKEAIDEMQSQPSIEGLVSGSGSDWASGLGRSVSKGNDGFATMTIGNIFRSEIILEK